MSFFFPCFEVFFPESVFFVSIRHVESNRLAVVCRSALHWSDAARPDFPRLFRIDCFFLQVSVVVADKVCVQHRQAPFIAAQMALGVVTGERFSKQFPERRHFCLVFNSFFVF